MSNTCTICASLTSLDNLLRLRPSNYSAYSKLLCTRGQTGLMSGHMDDNLQKVYIVIHSPKWSGIGMRHVSVTIPHVESPFAKQS